MKWVYFFGNGTAEGDKEGRDLLGGKGANLHEMSRLGLSVPPGFTITTEACGHFFEHHQIPEGLKEQVEEGITKIGNLVHYRFGDASQPLLVSVRSGAKVSMPGMMDTVLNLGLNNQTVVGLAEASQDARFAWDAYRRLIQMYSDVVLGVSSHLFEGLLADTKRAAGVENDSDLGVEMLKALVQKYLTLVREQTQKEFPQDPKEQLWGAIQAVFCSWDSARAKSYRRIHKIPDSAGTAVNIQAMVFGNMGEDSATGVAFTRDPNTGEKRFFGEFLVNAQGEDVVAGIRTPLGINAACSFIPGSPTLESLFPKVYAELVTLYQKLEKHYRDIQDIEFTIQKGKLYLLQTRSGKRTANAAIRIAVDMVKEGLIDEKTAIKRLSATQLEQLLHPRLDPRAEKRLVAKGLAASPGAASGEVVFSSEEAEELKKKGKPCILVRHETSPEDIVGMESAVGILTALGGLTSHAAVVARGMGRPCVAGCGNINIDYRNNLFFVGSTTVKKGEVITIDGSSGEVFLGKVPTLNSQVDSYFTEFMSWVDKYRTLKVRANAETPHDVRVARQFGAEGVGLCRTEHMFFDEARITSVREMIVSDTEGQRKAALDKLFPMQREDFLSIFREMKGFPVTIRLLDPPLHEFLPHTDREIELLASKIGWRMDALSAKIKSLREQNPMLGHRGCRLGVSFPEIYEMQLRAIFEAASDCLQERTPVTPEILIPFISSSEEFSYFKEMVARVAGSTAALRKVEVPYLFGSMIEIPRAALVADQLAKLADFFSFGTNDMTQMGLGLSRDDAASFLPRYLEKGLLTQDPFVSLDTDGVGALIKIAMEKGRGVKPQLKLGICGEHGGDTSTIEICHKLGFNYVSCSPFRVPVARLAAAHAALTS